MRRIIVSLFLSLTYFSGESWAGSAMSKDLQAPAYWCTEVKLRTFVREANSGELDTLVREHSPVAAGIGCVWDLLTIKSHAIRNASALHANYKLEAVEIHGRQCTSLKKGRVLKGILTTHETENSGESDRGTTQNKILYFKECPCPNGVKKEIPLDCVSWR